MVIVVYLCVCVSVCVLLLISYTTRFGVWKDHVMIFQILENIIVAEKS